MTFERQETNDRLRQAIYFKVFPPSEERVDTPYRSTAGPRVFTPDAPVTRSRSEALPPTFSPQNPTMVKLKRPHTSKHAVSEPYEPFQLFIASEEFLMRALHLAAVYPNRASVSEIFLRRFNTSRIVLSGLSSRFTPLYCAPFLTVRGSTASLIVWRTALATLRHGLYVTQALRFMQSQLDICPRTSLSFLNITC